MCLYNIVLCLEMAFTYTITNLLYSVIIFNCYKNYIGTIISDFPEQGGSRFSEHNRALKLKKSNISFTILFYADSENRTLFRIPNTFLGKFELEFLMN